MTKFTLLAAAALTVLGAASAYAGEGNGEPFPYRAPGVTIVNPQYASQTGSAQYPDMTGRATVSEPTSAYAQLLPTSGQNGIVQTANSLPAGFEEGTVAYTQAASVNRYLAQRDAVAQAALAARSTPVQPRG